MEFLPSAKRRPGLWHNAPMTVDSTVRNSRELLRFASIDKSFGSVNALRGVELTLAAGEIHALVGENGAGKSTLIKIASGVHAPDSGTIEVLGAEVGALSPGKARELGISVLYQQPALFGELSVAENLCIGTDGPFLSWKSRRRRARELLASLDAKFDVDRPAKELSLAEQQLVELARALDRDAPILILDEPTAVLPRVEADALLERLLALRARGIGILYISHRLEELEQIADRASVLRDGRLVWSGAMRETSRGELVRHMVGRSIDESARSTKRSFGPMELEVRGLSSRALGLDDVSFELRAGEVLGLAGLVGAGRSELASCLFGLEPIDAGEVKVRGKRVELRSASAALPHGLALVPEDRRSQGVVAAMSVCENIGLAQLARLTKHAAIDERAERELAERWSTALGVKARSIDAPVGELSGGNQQKVALARWLSREPRILILDEPTQGIDVAGRAEIHRLIRREAERGLAVLVISYDLPEVLALSDRIGVMRGGRWVGTLERDAATQESVLALALGVEHAA